MEGGLEFQGVVYMIRCRDCVDEEAGVEEEGGEEKGYYDIVFI